MSQAVHPYDRNGRPLVPHAERAEPFIPAFAQDTAQETVWFNPTANDAILKLYVGVTPCRSVAAKRNFLEMKRRNPLQAREFQTGHRTYRIPAGERRSLSSDFDMAIQLTECQEAECIGRKRACRDPSHHKMVMGGAAPQLINEGEQHRPAVHPALSEAAYLHDKALKEAAEFLRQKEIANQAILVASAELEKARAMDVVKESALAAAEAKSGPSPTHVQPDPSGKKRV